MRKFLEEEFNQTVPDLENLAAIVPRAWCMHLNVQLVSFVFLADIIITVLRKLSETSLIQLGHS